MASARFSPLNRATQMSSVQVLVIDPDARLIGLMRKVLSSLGFGAVYTASDGTQALELLRRQPIDLVITDWETDPVDGIAFVQYIRRGEDGLNRRLPVLMLTGKAKRAHVEVARDAGITEFLVKPFTVRRLCDRIILMIDHPRHFVLAPDYSGPDRRRRAEALGSDYDRRREGPKESRVIARHDESIVMRKGDDDIAIVNPDFALKRKIGMDTSLHDIFSPENIAQAQRILHHARNDYLSWAATDLRAVEQALAPLRVPRHGRQDIQTLARAVMQVKSRAGIFGYDLASVVAESFYDLCFDVAVIGERRWTACKKHLDALFVLFHQNIQGNGGVMGEELMRSLSLLSDTAD